MKKHEKIEKSLKFQTSLNQSFILQIVFWTVQKKAMNCFEQKLGILHFFGWGITFWTFLKTFKKKKDFCTYLLKKASYEQSDTWKKTIIVSYFQHKNFTNRTKILENIQKRNCIIFFFNNLTVVLVSDYPFFRV